MKKIKKLLVFLALISTLLICGVMTASAEWTPAFSLGARDCRNTAGKGDVYKEFDRENPVVINNVYYYKCKNYYYSTESSYDVKTVYCAVIPGVTNPNSVHSVEQKIDSIPVEAAYVEYNYDGVEKIKTDRYHYISKTVLPIQYVKLPASVKHLLGSENPDYMYTGCSLVYAYGPIQGTLKYFTLLPSELIVSIDKNNEHMKKVGNCIYENRYANSSDVTDRLVYVHISGLRPDDNRTMVIYSASSKNIGSPQIDAYAYYKSLALPGTTILQDSVEKIGAFAFYGANTDVVLPKYVKSIGPYAFYNCSSDSIRAMNGWGGQPNVQRDYILNNTIESLSIAFDPNDTVYFLGTKEEFEAALNGYDFAAGKKHCGTERVFYNCRVDNKWKIVHYDENFDRKCDSCGISTECNHICHKNNFFSKLCLFFWKLFKINQYCNACGFQHYQ